MKRTRIWQILGLVMIVLALTACGGNNGGDANLPPELPEDAESLVMLAKFDLTPGYIIILEAEGETYQYHASGARVVQKPK